MEKKDKEENMSLSRGKGRERKGGKKEIKKEEGRMRRERIGREGLGGRRG